MPGQLDTLWRQGLLSDLDLHFARLMARLAGSDAPELLLGAGLVSRWTGGGHVCLDLHRLAGRPLTDTDGINMRLRAPDTERWIAALRASAVVGEPGEFRPLILDERGRLYLYRYWAYERQLAEDLLVRAAAASPLMEPGRLPADLARLFPARLAGETDWQKVAAAAALLKRLCVISGGPGTGKTSTVIRILALLVAGADDRVPRIGLAAPTGKAAARMQEAIRLAKRDLALEASLKEAIPEDACTLHRLLGARPDSVYFRHDRANPLPLDVLVVDEASMVDLALMAKLAAALPARARLILLGDKDQLASVEAGAVLGDICGPAPGFSGAFRAQLETLASGPLPASEPAGSAVQDCIVVLRRSYRFGADSGIGHLARTVNQGEAEAALELLREGCFGDVVWRVPASARDLSERIADSIDTGYRPYLQGVRAGAGPEQVIEAFDRFRVLCPYRGGPAGVAALNRMIEDILQQRRLIDARQSWYAGRPVMITRNDYHLHLFNGDLGLVLPDPAAGGRLRVFFQTSDGRLRRFAPSRLPEHETVYAMTVHKSQGSEFERVLMMLPSTLAPGMTREVLYTGITRARGSVEIWASPDAVTSTIARKLWRSSGLRDALWGRHHRDGQADT